jgi:Ca2+-binding EF-hand superfamily protein
MAARRYAEDPDDPPDEHGAGISLDQILSLKEKFDGADLEGGGSLDMQEFMDAFGSIINKDGSMTEDQIARLFMQIDANADGGIDWSEFSTYMLMESKSNGQVLAKKSAEFYLPDSVGQRQCDVWHRDFANAILNEPQTAQYFTSSQDGTLRVWTSSNMVLSRTINYGSGWVSSMCLMPRSGHVVLCTADARLKVYDFHTWEPLFQIDVLTPATCCCSWIGADDTEFLALGDEVGVVTVIDMTRGVRSLKENPPKLNKRRGAHWQHASQRQVMRLHRLSSCIFQYIRFAWCFPCTC